LTLWDTDSPFLRSDKYRDRGIGEVKPNPKA
jgi:hypothetical protein